MKRVANIGWVCAAIAALPVIVFFVTAFIAVGFVALFFVLREGTKSRGRIVSPPGYRLLCVIEFFCNKRTYEEVVAQSAADMRQEYYEALATGRKFKAFWVQVRGTYALLKALGLSQFLRVAAEIFYRSKSGS